MPVWKFRSVEEMPRPERVTGAALHERVRDVWRRAFLLSPPAFPRGVQRFRSVDEANVARDEQTRRRMAARGR